MDNEKKNGINAFGLAALIVSSAIGTGIFGLPSQLAQVAAPGPALLAWLVCGIGVLALVLSLNNLAKKRPDIDSGLFGYAKAACGPLGEFMSGWTYWISAWIGNLAFATFLMSAIGNFIGIFKGGQNIASIIAAIVFLWILTFFVNNGVESANFVNTIVTICKVIPLFVFIVLVAMSFKMGVFTAHFWTNFASNVKATGVNGSVYGQIKNSMMSIMWVFIGIEGASVLSSRAKSQKAASQATIIGFISLVVIYVFSTILPYGVMSQAAIAKAAQPAMGSILEIAVGKWAAIIINLGVIISTIGSWLSWTMLPAETTRLMAKDKTLPASWGKLNKKKAPQFSLIITAVLQTLFLFSMLFTTSAYNFASTLAAAAILVSYMLVGIYQIKYSFQHKEWWQFFVGLICAGFEIMAAVLSGWQDLLLLTISFLPGFVLYYMASKEDHHRITPREKIVMAVVCVLAILAIIFLFTGKISING